MNSPPVKQWIWPGGSQRAEEHNSSNTVTKQFFPQGEQQTVSGTTTNYYYTRDRLGSVRELVNASGAVQTRYSYDSYGKTTLVSGSNLATKQYAGMYVHSPSGLHLTLYRAYDSKAGRWLSRDPIAERGGINLYDYVLNDPVNMIDPTGLCKCNIFALAMAHRDTLAAPTFVGLSAGGAVALVALRGKGGGTGLVAGVFSGMALGFAYGSGYLECETGNPIFDPNHPERLRDELAKALANKAAKRTLLQ